MELKKLALYLESEAVEIKNVLSLTETFKFIKKEKYLHELKRSNFYLERMHFIKKLFNKSTVRLICLNFCFTF